MKSRNGFVSNSSSTSFVITNISDEKKTLTDFVNETPELLESFLFIYNWYVEDSNFTQEKLLEDVYMYDCEFIPSKPKICTFGDNDCTTMGHVYDYMLRDGGESKSFRWEFYDSNR